MQTIQYKTAPRSPQLNVPTAEGDEGTAALVAIGNRFPPFGKALALQSSGEYARARAAFLDLVDQPALTALCLHQLGVIAAHRGENGRAVELFRRALAIEPQQGLFYRSLGTALERMGDMRGAVAALFDLGIMFQKQERHPDAVPCYQKVLSLEPLRYGAWVNLGAATTCAGDPAEAVRLLLCGLALYGRLVPEAGTLTRLLTERLDGVLERASAWQTLPAGEPMGPTDKIEDALMTLGKALGELRRPEEARLAYKLATTLAPGYPLAHWNAALNLLSLGEFREGWREYDWRWLWDRFPEPRRFLPMPQWRGEDLTGKRLYVFAEQGFGDSMQFAPLILQLLAQAAEIVYEVPTPLLRLMRQSLEQPGLKVVGRPDGPHQLGCEGRFDYVTAQMSLPALLGLEPCDLPFAAPWLRPDKDDAARWTAALPERKNKKTPRVGLAWSGRATHSDDAKRSMPTAPIQELVAGCETAQFVSLQVGAHQDAAKDFNGRMVETLGGLKDFADTAALISELDLVIAVDTAVAHLAGALGKPVFLMLPAAPDWRWGWSGETTPWYPEHRLFRQNHPGDWSGVIAAVRRALEE